MIELKLGDTIACKVSNPSPATLKATLLTDESLEYGHYLLLSDSGWYKEEKPQSEERGLRD